MNVLLIGSGGREHALAWKLRQSPLLSRLYCAPGNPGIAQVAELVMLDVADHGAVARFCRERDIGLVVPGPEAPLVAGLADDLERQGLRVFGCSRAAAQLEGSKGFTKDLCAEFGIPTAAYGRFRARAEAFAYLSDHPAPVVIKADGLAAGKGVTVAMTDAEAAAALEAIFSGAFGSAECVIEEFLEGEEASFFVLCDGEHILPLASAQDHKRVGEGDTGPNTGGMGAYSPAPVMTPEMERLALERIVRPTVDGMRARGTPFRGVLFAGLMISAHGPQLIEYNVRFGDPEAQALMPRLDSDLLELMFATVEGRLNEVEARWRDETALAVVIAAKGYPGKVETGSRIGLPVVAEGSMIFHAGTALRDGALVANGGRVLTVTALGPAVAAARAQAYATIARIDWRDGFFRRDIGWRALGRRAK